MILNHWMIVDNDTASLASFAVSAVRSWGFRGGRIYKSASTDVDPPFASSSSRLSRYDTILTQLTSQLPDLRPRLAEPLVSALVGMRQSVSAQQRAIAGTMPLKTKQQSKIQRLRRLLDNAKLSATGVSADCPPSLDRSEKAARASAA